MLTSHHSLLPARCRRTSAGCASTRGGASRNSGPAARARVAAVATALRWTWRRRRGGPLWTSSPHCCATLRPSSPRPVGRRRQRRSRLASLASVSEPPPPCLRPPALAHPCRHPAVSRRPSCDLAGRGRRRRRGAECRLRGVAAGAVAPFPRRVLPHADVPLLRPAAAGRWQPPRRPLLPARAGEVSSKQ